MGISTNESSALNKLSRKRSLSGQEERSVIMPLILWKMSSLTLIRREWVLASSKYLSRSTGHRGKELILHAVRSNMKEGNTYRAALATISFSTVRKPRPSRAIVWLRKASRKGTRKSQHPVVGGGFERCKYLRTTLDLQTTRALN